jgi:hypothetical protein
LNRADGDRQWIEEHLMTSRTHPLRGAGKLGSALRVAGRNGRKTGEIALAAGQVVARRMALGAQAMVDPLNADHVEFAKIIPEKARAFSEAGMTWLQWSGKAVEQMASFAASEMATAAEGAVALAGCRTPADVIAVQGSLATSWFARVMSQSISLGSLALRSQGETMAPLHRTVTENARRLNR